MKLCKEQRDIMRRMFWIMQRQTEIMNKLAEAWEK